MSKLTIRQATAEDSEFAYQTKKAAFRDYVLKVWEWDETRQRLLHEKRFAAQDFRVIQISGTDVGILAIQNTLESLKLNQIFILPGYQNKGIGSACMKRLIKAANAKRRSIYLQVLKVNPRAISFYRRLGFKAIGESSTHIQMERPVK